jgi:hypothetical protein
MPERIEQADHVAHQMQNRKIFDRFRGAAAAIAPHIRRDHTITRLGERRHLMAPGMPRLREAVAEQDGHAAAGKVGS